MGAAMNIQLLKYYYIDMVMATICHSRKVNIGSIYALKLAHYIFVPSIEKQEPNATLHMTA